MNNRVAKVCPICHEKYYGVGAISRRDNKTEICSSCGIMEALCDYYTTKKKEE